MSPTIAPAAIRKTFTVRATAQTAFQVFTKGFDRWWPRTHHTGATPLKQAIVEPGVGGRWYSVHEDGSENEWGDVLLWDPPTHLILAWRLNGQFTYDRGMLTEVEVRFTDVGGGETRVDFEHRGLEHFGAGDTADATRVSMDGGWGTILDSFKAVVSA